MSQPITWTTSCLEAHCKSTKTSCHQTRWEGKGWGDCEGCWLKDSPVGETPTLAWPPTMHLSLRPATDLLCPLRLTAQVRRSTVRETRPQFTGKLLLLVLLPKHRILGRSTPILGGQSCRTVSMNFDSRDKAYHSIHLSIWTYLPLCCFYFFTLVYK